MTRLTAVDAQTFWMSGKIPNDQFVLYAFDGAPGDIQHRLAELRARAAQCPDLRLRIVDDNPLRYPTWQSGAVQHDQFVRHDGELSWRDCLTAVAALTADQLDAQRATWRLHLFGPVHDAPVGGAAVTVVVLQISHALADGGRAAQLAGWLFGRADPVPEISTPPRGNLVRCARAAARAERELAGDIETGRLPAALPPRPALLTNLRPEGRRRIAMLVTDRAAIGSRATVTVSALAAIGAALAGQLRSMGADATQLGAEVPMALPGIRHARNHFRNIGVGLYPDLPAGERRERIAADLRDGRLRAEHPAARAGAAAVAATPAVLLRWGVRQFDAGLRSAVVTGNTVVSSVYRGPADLRLGPAPVLLTASFPALSPMMGLTHGIHGIGDTIAVSVHTADSVFGPEALDEYLDRLEQAWNRH